MKGKKEGKEDDDDHDDDDSFVIIRGSDNKKDTGKQKLRGSAYCETSSRK